MDKPQEPKIVPPTSPQTILQVIATDKGLQIGSSIKDKKQLISLLADIIKIIITQDESRIVVPK
ncbi:MAG: hypothetical protein WC169_12510 [Dehalococcoidia bacterium]